MINFLIVKISFIGNRFLGIFVNPGVPPPITQLGQTLVFPGTKLKPPSIHMQLGYAFLLFGGSRLNDFHCFFSEKALYTKTQIVTHKKIITACKIIFFITLVL